MHLQFFARRIHRHLTDLGTITHHYWHENGWYCRRPLAGGVTERWTGLQWELAETSQSAERMAA